MSLEEFWNGPPRLAVVYRNAENLRRKRRNTEAWRDGQYMASAISATVMNVFRKKGTAPIEYLREPLPLDTAEVEARRERDARLAEQRLIDKMNRMAYSGKTAKK